MDALSMFIQQNLAVFLIIVISTTILKGIALWKAARLSHSIWFVFLLATSTFGILETIYIIFIAKKYSVEVKEIQS
jgi:uncharacterized protein (DUF983 family)